MIFANVEANLLYIRENDLTPEFQSKLCSFNQQTIPLYIIVQLRVAPNGFEPMINNLKEIRIEKAKNKIKNWIRECFDSNQTLLIRIDDESSSIIRVDIDFGEINRLSAFCTQEDAKAVHSYIKSKFRKKNFKINHF